MQANIRHMMQSLLARVHRDERGAIAVETGMLFSVLLLVALGVLDFGMVLSHKTSLANAARSGMQYALVRKPQSEDFSAVVNAVNAAAPNETAAGDRNIDVNLYCRCPDDDTDVDCTSEDGDDLSCPDATLRAAYLKITISESYPMMFNIFGISDNIRLREDVTARLN